MLRLRLTVVLLLLWLAVLFNIERVHEPINLASFVYPLAGLLAVMVIFLPLRRKVALVWFTVLSLVVYAGLKWFLGYSFLGAALPITITECGALCVTNILAWCVAYQTDEFMRGAANLTAIQSCEQILALADGESKMYDEVQRARRFKRNLTLATVAFTGKLQSEDLDRLTRHARLEIARKFLETRVARRLLQSTSPGDLVVNRDGAFVLMFPEVTEDSVRPMLQEVAEELHAELGLRIQIGMAQFPDKECTLTGLIEHAEAEIRDVEWTSEQGVQTGEVQRDLASSPGT